MGEYLEKDIDSKEILYLAFNNRNKKRLTCTLWFAVKVMYKIYQNRFINKSQLLRDIVKEIDWNLEMNTKLGSKYGIQGLKNLIVQQL